MARETLVDEHGLPLIQGSRDDAPLYRADGKRMKAPQPRKAQRGQKKKKKKPSDPVATSTDAAAEVPLIKASSSSRKKSTKKQALPAFDTVQSGDVVASVIPSQQSSRAQHSMKMNAPLTDSPNTPEQDRLEEILKRVPVRTPQAVPKPLTTSAVNIRDRDINQLKRRFGKDLVEEDGLFDLPFVPSDPDFPFDVPDLVVTLLVSKEYPEELVELRIKSGLEVGFARNIEREFESERIGLASGRGLLGMLTWLDRNLERLLALKKSDTIKIVRHGATSLATYDDQASSSESEGDDAAIYQMPIKFWTFQEKRDAAAKREEEIGKLKTRLNPQIMTEETLDLQLQDVIVRLHVPELYPLEPCWLLVLQGPEEIEAQANNELRKGSRDLMRQMNWVLANLKSLERQGIEERELLEAQLASEREAYKLAQSRAAENSITTWSAEQDGFRPVEGHNYSVPEQNDGYTSTSEEENAKEEEIAEQLETVQIMDTTTQAEKGTAIDCTVSMQHLSTLEAASVSLTIKCYRCKANAIQVNDVTPKSPTQIACPQCMSIMSIALRPLLVHAGNLKRIGYLDLESCAASLLNLVTLKGVCAECPAPDDLSEQAVQIFTGLGPGQAQTKPCRACYAKLQLEIDNFHFLTLSSTQAKPGTRLGRTTDTHAAAIPKEPSKDALRRASKHKGQPLPDFGLCRHYRRSFRWFRFPCCRRVYACDICHDLLAGAAPALQAQAVTQDSPKQIQIAGVANGKHRHELAQLQICGFCSTETAVNAQARCQGCGASLVKPGSAPGTLGSGFWEGGEGTRDQRLMNRHDKRKYRKKL